MCVCGCLVGVSGELCVHSSTKTVAACVMMAMNVLQILKYDGRCAHDP